MLIGRSRVGIGRIGIVSSSFEDLQASASITILGIDDAWVWANMSIVEVFELSALANMDIDPYNHREILANMSILERMPIPISANLSISGREVRSVQASMSIITTRYLQAKTAISIIGQKYLSIPSNLSILGTRDCTARMNLSVAVLLELYTRAAISISDALDTTTLTNITVSNISACVAAIGMTIIDNHYWAIGPLGEVLDISGMVAEPNPAGFGTEISKLRLSEGRRVSLLDKGIPGGEYTFHVYFGNDSERQAFQQVVNNDAENHVLHIGRSDRFYYVNKMSINPKKIKTARGPVQEVKCWMEDPCMYHAWDQGLSLGASTLPQESIYKFNYGTAPTPILFKIGGFYSGGQLTHPYVEVWNGSTETSLYIGPGLLSNEYAELTLGGWHKRYLTHSYADDYSTNNHWPYDAVQSGCTLAGGQVSVPAGKWFYYKFQGHPLKDDIVLEATITKIGSPIIQFSTDGVTWSTAIADNEIINGTKLYYLTGTEKLQTVYVRFYSPSGSSMTIQDVSFTFDRDISSQFDQVPVCPAQESRKLKFVGSGSARARLQTTFRSRWYAQ